MLASGVMKLSLFILFAKSGSSFLPAASGILAAIFDFVQMLLQPL